ncbi:MAG: CoA pyrophosphatase, partial [Candidatus Neomarinimicrobiota bacterium]|nr:CoA pyrophosphatase [Candidatus Neomarinimicrobiota bacterium]
MIPELITQLTQRLSQPLPGKKAQDIMMVYPGYPSAVLKAYVQRVPAGVLILLFPRNDGWHFFLTKRTDRVDHHKGQISLPGGVVQDGESLMEAALRETHEEIGVASTLVTVIGSLTSFNIPVSG